MRFIFDCNKHYVWKYYLHDDFFDFDIEISEKQFEEFVIENRLFFILRYDPDDVNRQNYYLDEHLVCYRVRSTFNPLNLIDG